jgi:hypothetical protein
MGIEQFSEFLKSQIEIGSVLEDVSEKLGVGTQELQAFEYAGSLVGVSAEEAAHSIGFLNRSIGEAALGSQEQIQTFQKLGIAFKEADGSIRPVLDVAKDVADGFAKLGSHEEKAAYATKIFGRQGAALLPILGKGREELEATLAEFEALGGGMSEDFVKAADDAGDSLTRLRLVTQGIKSQVALAVLPTFTHFVGKLTELGVQARKYAKDTNVVQTALAAFGAAGVFAFARMAWGLGKFLGLTSGGGLLSVLKLGATGALLLGLYVIFDDLFTLMTGGESVAGELLDSIFGIGTSKVVVQQIKDAFADLTNFLNIDTQGAISLVAKTIIGGLVVSCYALVTVGKLIGDTFVFAFDAIAGKLTDADKDLKQFGKDMDSFGKVFEGVTKWVQNGPVKHIVEQQGAGGVPTLGAAGAPAIAGATPAVVNQTNNTTVTVQGGANPKQTGANVSDGVKDAMNAAAQEAREALRRGK